MNGRVDFHTRDTMTLNRRFYLTVVGLMAFATSVAITAQAQTPTLDVPATVDAGSPFTVTVANGTGNYADWVTVTPATGPDNAYIAWLYLSDSISYPPPGVTNVALHFVASVTAGTYNVRFFFNNSWTKLATSADITVRDVTGSYLPKYAADGSFVDSAVYESGGNIGIGTTSPTKNLHVFGAGVGPNATVRINSYSLNNYYSDITNDTTGWGDTIFNNYNGTSTGASMFFRMDGNTKLTIQETGNVGIGTTAPSQKFEVAGTKSAPAASGSTQTGIFRVANNPVDNSNVLDMGNFSAYPYGSWIQATERTNLATNYPLALQPNGGNVGIGTSFPQAKLHVTGDLRVDGNIAAKYQDVAEWVDSVEPLEAGTIVVIDDSTDNRVAAAAQPYDLRVAGAISASPGVVLGEPGSGRVLVAQSGRVRIKADASYGAIHAGDLLVSSPTKGAAMRSEPVDVGGVKMHRPGTLIGKALEPLDEGIGEILVLLTLQ